VRIKTKSRMFLVEMAVVSILAVALAETTAIGQAPSGSSAPAATHAVSGVTKSVPKTPWGKPDLQGIWSNEGTIVPFERPKEFGDRQFLTDAEHQKALDDLAKRNARVGRDNRAGRGTEKDVARAYNDLWFDKPTAVSYRTSQIIDPPDGRMPAYTLEPGSARRSRGWKDRHRRRVGSGNRGGQDAGIVAQ